MNISDSIGPNSFHFDQAKGFDDLSLEQLDRLQYPVYIIDYNWRYLFLNKYAKNAFGDISGMLIGKSAKELFAGPQYQDVFEKLSASVENRVVSSEVIYSPLRGAQVFMKGFPMKDCYAFTTSMLPGKEELMDELRTHLKKKSAE